MTTELKKGYYIYSYYDKHTKSYITMIMDNESNEIGHALFSGNMTDRNADIQYLKELFYDPERWEDFKNEYKDEDSDMIDRDELEDGFSEPIEVHPDDEDFDWDAYTYDEHDWENVEESLSSKIKETKNKTKKYKLPALSTLSPIMPDATAGIDTFNSGVGLSEEWIHRNELEARLKKMGFRYKFNKYTDEQLYKIYQERLKYLEKKKKEKQQQKQRDDEQENKRVNSKDSFMKNGIEFESEDAAREYFGESMNKKVYLNTLHEAWDVEEDLYDRWGDDPESLRIEKYDDDSQWCVYDHGGNSTYYFGDNKQDCVDWCVDRNERYYFYESLNNSNKKILTEALDKKIHITYRKSNYGGFTVDGTNIDIDSYSKNFETIEGSRDSKYALILLQSNISWSSYSAIIFSDDLEKCKDIAVGWLNGNYTKLASEPLTERHLYAMLIDLETGVEISAGDSWQDTEKINKGWREFSLNESFKSNKKFKTIREGLKYFDRKAFDEKCETPELELLYEGIKNSLDTNDIKKLSSFIGRANSADEINTYIRGLLSEDLDCNSIDYYKLASNILDYASNEWKVWDTDIYNVFADRDKIDFYVKGDWKHDHWAFDDALKEYLSTNYPNMKYELDKYEIDDGNEYDSDNYPAVHSLIILKDEGPLVLNLLEPDNEAIVESLNESEEMSDQELMQSMIKQLNNSLGENPSKSQLHNYNQRVREIRKMFMDESLNESYIEEWWGQTDEDPHDLEAYGLKVIKKDVVGDSTLYRFVGRRSDLERAMSDGYFMAFEYGEDVEHSKDLDKTYDKLVDELIVELHKIGFELDNSVEYPVGKNLFGGKHIQVINPNLKYPSFETEGEELSEEEAHKLFRDDLKEIEYILDKFEEDNEIMLTFNFGPNKDMVITGGIDIR